VGVELQKDRHHGRGGTGFERMNRSFVQFKSRNVTGL